MQMNRAEKFFFKSITVYKLVKFILKINSQNLSSAANRAVPKLAQAVWNCTTFPEYFSVS